MADADSAQAADRQTKAIRTALDAGASIATVAERAGLSRERIYQIRDGRR